MQINVKRSDKIIIVFYIFLAISFTIVMFDINSKFDTTALPDLIPKPINELEIVKTFDIDRERIFLIMTDLENYEKVLPKNVKSVDILEQNDNVILAEYTVSEAGIQSKLLVQHTIYPYYEHVVEVMDGDAKGTKLTQKFTDTDCSLDQCTQFDVLRSVTTVNTAIKFDLKGILSPFSYLGKSNIEHAANTVLSSFITFGYTSENEIKVMIDDLYREILLRPADYDDFEHWIPLLENETLTLFEIRTELLNSDEKKDLLIFQEIKSVSDLDVETKKIIDDLYREILLRPADNESLLFWGILLENGKITNLELRKNIASSEEAISLQVHNPESKILVTNIFNTVYGTSGPYYQEGILHYDPRIDPLELGKSLKKYTLLLKTEEFTPDEIKLEFEQLKKDGKLFLVDDLASVNQQFLDWEECFIHKTCNFNYKLKYDKIGGIVP